MKPLKPLNLKKMDQEGRAWLRGYDWAMKNGYGYDDSDTSKPDRDVCISQSVRDCRIIAMAYAMGWMNGRKSR